MGAARAPRPQGALAPGAPPSDRQHSPGEPLRQPAVEDHHINHHMW